MTKLELGTARLRSLLIPCLIVVIAIALAPVRSAQAQFPVNEPFDGATTNDPAWVSANETVTESTSLGDAPAGATLYYLEMDGNPGLLTTSYFLNTIEVAADGSATFGTREPLTGIARVAGGFVNSMTVLDDGSLLGVYLGPGVSSRIYTISGATLTAADVSQTAEHKAMLSGGATIDASGNALIDAPVCAVNGTVTAGTTSGACLP